MVAKILTTQPSGSIDISNLGKLFLVGLIWGVTNPLIKRGAGVLNGVVTQNPIQKLALEVWILLTNWKYLLPMSINQCGSVLYYFVLNSCDLSLAVPVSNAMTFLFTAVTGWMLKENTLSKGSATGMILILLGVMFYLLDQGHH